MNEKRLFTLLDQLWVDLNFQEFYWYTLALALILVFSWWSAFRLHKQERGGRNDSARRSALQAFGAGSLKRVAFPLIALLLVLILRNVLVILQREHLSLLYLAEPLLVSWALVSVLVYLLRCVLPYGGVLSSFERFITWFVWLGMVLHITGVSEPVIVMLEKISFSVGKQKLNLWMLTEGVVTVSITLLIALWIASLIESRLQSVNQMDMNVRVLLARMFKALLLVIALFCSLSLAGIDITTLSVFGGALAVGLGFGLQKIASNYVSGFIILLDRSIRIGNLVTVDDKTYGKVTQITTRYTVLHTLTGAELIVPNELLVSNVVRNLSRSDPRVRLSTNIQVAYNTDLEMAMRLLVEAARQHPRVLTDPAPGALLTEFADSGISLELGFWVADPEAGTGDVRSDINLAIWKAFREKRIEIPFPQRELHIRAKDLPI